MDRETKELCKSIDKVAAEIRRSNELMTRILKATRTVAPNYETQEERQSPPTCGRMSLELF